MGWNSATLKIMKLSSAHRSEMHCSSPYRVSEQRWFRRVCADVFAYVISTVSTWAGSSILNMPDYNMKEATY